MVSFKFNERKAAEALVYLAGQWNDITQFYAAKVLFYAEKMHINEYARPILADTFIAMKDGPVPTKVYDLFKKNYISIKNKSLFTDALSFNKVSWNLTGMKALREPDLSLLSKTDIECIDAAIKFCKGKGKSELSSLTHKNRSWKSANRNTSMNYAHMIDDDNPNKAEILEELQDFSRYGIL